MAAKKKAAKKAAARKRVPKAKFGADMVIREVGENNRRKGTAAYERFQAMAKYVARNKGATVADVIAKTPFKRPGFNRELGKTIKVERRKPAAAPAPAAA